MSTAIERLQSGHYNSAGVSGANPGGLGNGGHVQNFPSALQDIGDVAQGVGGQAAQAVGAAGSAGASAAAAAADRQLAQQAAIAAALFDPAAFARKAGDRFDGIVSVGPAAFGSVNLIPGTTAANGGYVEFMMGGARQAYIGNATDALVFAVAEGGRSWSFEGPVLVQGFRPYTAANDGSGSGLDADMLRGLYPASGGFGSTVVVRDSAGGSGFESLYVNQYISFQGGLSIGYREAGWMQTSHSWWVEGTLTAGTVTERSDRSLKEDIVDIEPVLGRLRPVRYRLKETGEERIGFIAQEIDALNPLAACKPEDKPMEVRLMGVIAILAAQLNAAQDRLDALEQER